MTISKNAEHLLRKIKQVEVFPADETKIFGENAILALLEHNYVEEIINDVDIETCQLICTGYSITDAGCAYLRFLTSDRIRFAIPLVLSCLSLVISILSLFLSPFISHLYGL